MNIVFLTTLCGAILGGAATGCVELGGYMLYDQQACAGQSQLGIVTTEDIAGCAALCSADEECLSFEVDVTYSADNCRLSSSCIAEYAMSWDDQCLYVKLPPTMMPTADPTTTTLTPTQDPTTTLTPTQDPTTTLTPTQDPTTTTTEEPCEDDDALLISEAANYGMGYTLSGCSDVVSIGNGKNLCRGRKFGPQIRAACPATCGLCPEV